MSVGLRDDCVRCVNVLAAVGFEARRAGRKEGKMMRAVRSRLVAGIMASDVSNWS